MVRVKVKLFVAEIALSILMMTACSPATPTTDLAQCRVDLAKLPAGRSDHEQLDFVHNCMEAKDWRAPDSCVTAHFEGTWMCDYKRK